MGAEAVSDVRRAPANGGRVCGRWRVRGSRMALA
jgi:hypothetical protein